MLCEICGCHEADRFICGTRVRKELSSGETTLEVIRHTYCADCANGADVKCLEAREPRPPHRRVILRGRIEGVSRDAVTIAVVSTDQPWSESQVWHVRPELLPRAIQVVGNELIISGTSNDIRFLRDSCH